MNQAIFEINNLKHRYQDKIVLESESISITPASITGLTGPNGSGKSTLLKILALIEKPSEGRVFYKGVPVESFSKFARTRVTLLTQEPYLLKRSVFNNIAYGLKLRKDTDHLNARIYDALEAVGLPGPEFAKRHWNELSGGEAQRVALAARLILKPDVLLLDEPTANVDAQSSRLIRKAVLNARSTLGTTLVIASHDKEWLYDISDTILNLFQGRILKGSRLSILFGPWERHSEGLYKKSGTGTPPILVPKPPQTDSAALFPAESFTVCTNQNDIPINNAYIQGIVTLLSLEKKTEKVFITIRAGEHEFTAGLKTSDLHMLNISPGTSIFLCYSLKSVKYQN